jgi:F-type H+-transporting ATPase subunit delta
MATTTGGEGIASVYAVALYDVAAESGKVANIEAELLDLSAGLKSDPRLIRFLETPTVPFEAKRKVLLSALSGLSKPVLNLLSLLIQHGRIALFDAMVDAYHRYANEKAGIAEVSVQSARALDSKEQENLIAMLHKKLKQQIKLKEEVRPELLGGMVVTHSGRSWDASIAHRLSRIVDKIEEVKTLGQAVNQ